MKNRDKLKERIADEVSCYDMDRANSDEIAERILQEIEKKK